jgi:integration host factor subunit beta
VGRRRRRYERGSQTSKGFFGRWAVVKSELIENLASRADLTLAAAEQVVDLFFDQIAAELVANGRVEIRGFGAWSVRTYEGYQGRNPKTGESIAVPPKRLPFWKTGQELKQRVDAASLRKTAGRN